MTTTFCPTPTRRCSRRRTCPACPPPGCGWPATRSTPATARTFQAADLQDYFNAQDWYVGIYSPEEFDPLADTLLNRYEAANLALIRAQEEAGSGNSPRGAGRSHRGDGPGHRRGAPGL